MIGLPTRLPSPISTACQAAPSRQRSKVAYLVSRFPKITETFILYELLAVQQQEMDVELFPLQRERTEVMHPEAVPLVERAHFHPLLSWDVLRAHWHFLRRKPGTYLTTLGALVRGNWGSLRYFTAALAFFPKMVYFAECMAAEKVDHVHAHFASHPAAAAFAIHRLTGIPYSFTAHGSDLHRDRHMLRQKVAEAAFVVAISEYNKELIVAECGQQARDKVAVIHCGIDTEVFRPAAAGRGAEAPHPFQILCIGTLHEVKGQRYLIEACGLLCRRGLDVRCAFVGDGPDRAALSRQGVRAGLADRLEFHGRLPREEVVALLQRADAAAAPSVPTRDGRREGIPVALMEAMACGVPVVASDLSGIPELVQDQSSGLLVPPRDATALADALQRLAGDSALRRRLGHAGREKVVREFDLHANAAMLMRSFVAGEHPC